MAFTMTSALRLDSSDFKRDPKKLGRYRFLFSRTRSSFSGLRVGFTVANALALPDGKKVIAVGSGEAMALALSEELKIAQNIAVIGDARRQMCWLGKFDCNENGTEKLWISS